MKKKIYGVDVSEDKLDIATIDGQDCNWLIKENNTTHWEIKNTRKSIYDFFTKRQEEDIKVVCEASGVYHLVLLNILNKNNIPCCVVNPKQIKNHKKVLAQREKTDPGDAKATASFGNLHNPSATKVSSDLRLWIQSMLKSIDSIQQELSNLKNRYHAYKKDPYMCKEGSKATKESIDFLEKKKGELEDKLLKEMQTKKGEEFKRVHKIKGVGDKISSAILGYFGAFEDFETSKQVTAFIGMDPKPRDSGKHKGKRTISKQGNRYIRKLLYLASSTAGQYNSACRDLKERLEAKGKDNDKIRIAIANKLLRQIFAIVKYKREWRDDYALNFR